MIPLEQDLNVNQDLKPKETVDQYRTRIVGNIKSGVIPSHVAKDPKFFEAFKAKMDSMKAEEVRLQQPETIQEVQQVEPVQSIERPPEQKSMLELIVEATYPGIQKGINILKGAGERTGELLGSLVETKDIVQRDVKEFLGIDKLGGLVKQKGDILPTYYTTEELDAFIKEKGIITPEKVTAKALKDLDLGYEEQKTWEDVKESFSKGGALSGTAYGDVFEYGLEQGIKSIPDMAMAVISLPAYIFSRSGEIGEERAKNKGKEKTELKDVLEAAPFATASALFERLGVKGMSKAAQETFGKEMLKSGFDSYAKELAKAGAKGMTKEASTEAIQEGLIEYVGEKLGTEAELSFKEGLDRAAGAAVAGGLFGGVATTASKTVGDLKKDVEGQVKEVRLPIEEDVQEAELEFKKDDEAPKKIKPVDKKQVEILDKLKETKKIISEKEVKTKDDIARIAEIDEKINEETEKLEKVEQVKEEVQPEIEETQEKIIEPEKVKDKPIDEGQEAIDYLRESKDFEDKPTEYKNIIDEISQQVRFVDEKGVKLTPKQIESGISAIKTAKTNKSSEVIIKTLENAKTEGLDLYQLPDSKGGQRGKFAETKRIKPEEYRKMLSDVEARQRKAEGKPSEPEAFFQKKGKEERAPIGAKKIHRQEMKYEDVKHQKETTFFYAHNKEKAPDLGKTFAQDIEPSGKYIVSVSEKSKLPLENYEYGYITFNKPYVIEHETTRHGGWKTKISDKYNGLTGKKLTEALIKDGYDGIITRDKDSGYTKEIVSLQRKPIEKTKTKKQAPKKKEPDVFKMGTDKPMSNYQQTFKTKGFPERSGTNQIDIDGKKVTLDPEDKPTRREGIQAQVENIIGPRLYNSKIRDKSTLGNYSVQNSEIRTQDYFDVEVLAHEMAHYLDMHSKMKGAFKSAYKNNDQSLKEAKSLSYTSEPNLTGPEGFAEYVRLWLTQYNKAKESAPNLTERFEAVLSKEPKLKKKMEKLQVDMHKWFAQGDMARLNAVTSGNQYSAKDRFTKKMNQKPASLLRQKYIDHIHAAKVITSDVKGMLGDATTDPYKQLQLINGVEGLFEQSVKHGAPSFSENGDITFVGPSLEDVWGQSVKHSVKRLRDQEKYFISRRAKELKKQGRENLLTDGMIREGLKLGDKYPYFKEAFKKYQEYNKNMMKFYVETGYITQESATKMSERNKEYVPFHRVAEGIIESGQGGSASFQKLKGGTQNIRHVYDNILMQDSKHLQAALKANAMRELYSEGLNSQEGSKYFTKIDADAKPVKLLKEQMLDKTGRMIRELGIDIDTELGADMFEYFDKNPEELMFWSFGNKPKTTETMVDSFIDKDTGKRVWVELNKENKLLPDMIDSLDGFTLPKGSFGKALELAMKIKQFQTLTITAMMQFAGPNIIRDQQQAYFLSGGRYRPLIDPIKGFGEYLKAALGKKSLFNEMRAQGGPGGGRVRTFLENEWGFAEKKDYKVDKPFYHPTQIAKDLLDIYVGIMDSAEMATRIGFYSRMRSQGKSARESAFMAREISTDFAKHGSYAPFVLLQRTVPFFGAYVQSVDRDLRGMFERNGKIRFNNLLKNPEGEKEYTDLKYRMAMIGSMYVAIHIALALIGEDEEKYKQLTPDQKARFFHFFIGDEHYTLPKPHGLVTLFGSLAEGMTDIVKGQPKESVQKDLLFAIAYHLGMDATPGVINPILELQTNKSFTGAPIVGRAAEGRSPELQYSDRTPQMYVKLGKKLGVSPDKARHFVRGYTGYLEEIITENVEEYMWDYENWGERPSKKTYLDMATKQFLPKKVPYRTKYTEGYYDLKKRAEMIKADIAFSKSEMAKDQKLIKELLSDKEKVRLLALSKHFSKIDKAIKSIQKQVSLITYNKNLTEKEKTDKIEKLYADKNKVLKETYFAASKIISQTEKAIKDKRSE